VRVSCHRFVLVAVASIAFLACSGSESNDPGSEPADVEAASPEADVIAPSERADSTRADADASQEKIEDVSSTPVEEDASAADGGMRDAGSFSDDVGTLDANFGGAFDADSHVDVDSQGDADGPIDGRGTGDARSADVSDATGIVDVEAGPTTFYPLHVIVSGGAGTVTVTSTPPQSGLLCASDCFASYAAGSTIRLVAQPSPGSFFTGWAAECLNFGTQPTCELSMTLPHLAVATFTSQANVVFWTSADFTVAELAAKGGAPDGGANAQTVLAGADAACAEAATSSGSVVPRGKYVAWMSATGQNAIDRLRIANNGRAPRGWVRVDGRPFLDQISSHVLYPSLFDERGQPGDRQGFTGTDELGRVDTFNCAEWTDSSSASAVWLGSSVRGGPGWTAGFLAGCDHRGSVFCMQVDYTVAISLPLPTPPTVKRVFLGSPFVASSGIDAADAQCQTAAANAGFGGTFRALLTPNGATAASRFHPGGTIPYVRPDGVIVTDTDRDLLSTSPYLLAPVSVDATSQIVSGVVYAGAASPADGPGPNCSNWMQQGSTDLAMLGNASAMGSEFFNAMFTAGCDVPRPIYCLQD
jgi:hypothetical protein